MQNPDLVIAVVSIVAVMTSFLLGAYTQRKSILETVELMNKDKALKDSVEDKLFNSIPSELLKAGNWIGRTVSGVGEFIESVTDGQPNEVVDATIEDVPGALG